MITFERKKLKVYFDSPNMFERAFVRKALTILHPDAQKIPLFVNKRWDGLVKFYSLKGYFLLGLMKYVLEYLDKRNIQYNLVGFEENDVSWIKFSKKIAQDNRDYQRMAIIEYFKHNYGVIKVPTRGGKTIITSEIIRLRIMRNNKEISLFIVDSKDLFEQAIGDISSFLGIDTNDIGKIREKDFEPKQITIAMIQTLQSILKNKKGDRFNKCMKFLKTVDFLIVDEIHEFGSKDRTRVIKKCSEIESFLSLSATPWKESDLLSKMNIQSFTGGLLYEIHEKELVERKVLSRYKVLLFYMAHKKKFANQAYSNVLKTMIYDNPDRNNVLRLFLQICQRLRLKTLVLFSSKYHGYEIEKVTGYTFLCGDHSMEERKYAKDFFLSGKGGILLASDIWKKGVTISEAEVFLNADGGKDENLLIQKKGRVLGTTKNKEKALIVDFIDVSDDYFSIHSLNRIKVYEESVGKDNIFVFDIDDKDIWDDVYEFVHNWFNLS